MTSPLPALAYRPFERCREARCYVKLDKVGEGTFGEVHKGQHKTTNEIVALKKILMKNEKEGFPLTALREIKLLKRLRHINVLSLKEIVHVPPSDLNKQQGSIYLVFEFMDYDLGGLLNSHVRFSAPEIMCLTKQLLEGMHYIHRTGILHRDMKASNVLLSKSGVLKIADFGLARVVFPDQAGPDKEIKYTPTVCTRWYRPPEVLLGQRNYTAAVDMWGVGCVVAELFVGRAILTGCAPGATTDREHDIDQYLKICELCGTPTVETWPDAAKLPLYSVFTPKRTYTRRLEDRFRQLFQNGTKQAVEFVDALLVCDPTRRMTASAALDHNFLWSDPPPATIQQLAVRLQTIPSTHEFASRNKESAARQRHPPAAAAAALPHHQQQQQQQQQQNRDATSSLRNVQTAVPRPSVWAAATATTATITSTTSAASSTSSSTIATATATVVTLAAAAAASSFSVSATPDVPAIAGQAAVPQQQPPLPPNTASNTSSSSHHPDVHAADSRKRPFDAVIASDALLPAQNDASLDALRSPKRTA